MSRDELEQLVHQIRELRGSDNELISLVNQFRRAVPHPNPIDLIFHHSPELSPREIVEIASSYRPISVGWSDK